ncbi:hypothetical protein DFH08DRAFT_1026931 [Mycena albidolilacea]|uniref:Uncharacterized protein n=1 Tax=Mycena albidolilacea TaxID=1033008 RepID=A0AAD6ZK81_9AGAR|nr:hypothetical protein DFH08DRAFT_1026931 [Mycena albidolilacea]
MAVTISPSVIVQGLLVTKTESNWIVQPASGCRNTCIYQSTFLVAQLLMGIGIGLLYATTFVVLSPLDVSDNATAVALLAFFRVFSQAWGVNIAGAILKNGLQKRISLSLIASLSRNREIAYIIILLIQSMSQPLRTEVRDVFLRSLQQIWIAMAVLCGVGLCTLGLIKDIPLQTTTDKKWDTVNKEEQALQLLRWMRT